MRGQDLLDRLPEGRQQLALLGLRVRFQAGAREQVPALGLERDLAALPRALAQLHGSLEQRELVDPGRETTGTAKVVEAPKDAHQRVVRGFQRDVVELAAPEMREARPPPCDFEPRGADEQRMEASNRCLPSRLVGAELVEPAPRLLVERCRWLHGRLGDRFHHLDHTVRHPRSGSR